MRIHMQLEHLTTMTQQAINEAAQKAQTRNNPALTPLHIIAAIAENDFGRSFLQALHVDLKELHNITQQELDRLPQAEGGQLAADQKFEQLMQRANQAAQQWGDAYISLEHMILAIADTQPLPDRVQQILEKAGVTRQAVEQHMHTIRKGRTVQDKNAEQQYEALERYCHNLTQRARDGKLDPVIGRHDEVRRVIQILSRRTKNNPVLIGEPGVGKTAIVEGIAQRIIDNDVPESLQSSTICSLDLGLLIAGAKYQGEFEERIKGVLREVEESDDHIIVFIDELHMLVGAGASSSGGMDASNLLKPALARGTLHCIGATTDIEYKKYIEKDAALERRFQKVLVEEPTIEDAISILRGLKERYELHHGIRIKDQALVEAVQMSARNITDRYLPDKAIDLVDEAAALVKMSIDSQPEEIDQLERKIRQLEIEKVALQKESDEASQSRLQELEKELADLKEKHDSLLNTWKAEKEPLERIRNIKEQIENAQTEFHQAERQGDYARASEIKYGKLMKLQDELKDEQNKLAEVETSLIKEYVDEHDIATVLSRWTGIPVEKLEKSETEKLLEMENTLKRRVVGQDEAVQKVAHAIQMHRTGLTDPNRPIGSFLFLGPTGVGKTEVARTLADFLFNDPHRLIRIDMSEYMEKHSVSRLIGAPPGYVGYEEGGQLTESVRKHPFSVILFDEIEKAHNDVFNIFLQILDEGHVTDNQGRRVSFKNAIIIMTSNIGSEYILDAQKLDDEIKNKIRDLLHQNFRPEFLNRIDDICFFRLLQHEDVKQIARIQLEQLQKRLQEQQITLELEDAVVDHLAQEGYAQEFGARPLKRAIQSEISVPISQHMLKHPDTQTITIGVRDDSVTIV